MQYLYFCLPGNQYQRWTLCDAEVRLYGSYVLCINPICEHQLVTNIHTYNSFIFFNTIQMFYQP